MGIERIKKSLDFMFGQTNAQQLKRYDRELREINSLEPKIKSLGGGAALAYRIAFRAPTWGKTIATGIVSGFSILGGILSIMQPTKRLIPLITKHRILIPRIKIKMSQAR